MSSPKLTLYTTTSPAAQCISVALEELNVPYNAIALSLKEKEQKSEWFLKINPNGRMPAIVDHTKDDFAVWESSAILLYIAQHFDAKHIISYDPVKEPKLYSEQLQWLCFADGGVASMSGQAVHFLRFAPEDYPYAIKRYTDETKRLYSVLEQRLNGREWLVGSHYSLADIKIGTWVRGAKFGGIDIKEYPNLEAWVKRIVARPGTNKGLSVPELWDPVIRSNLTKEQTRTLGAAIFGFKKLD